MASTVPPFLFGRGGTFDSPFEYTVPGSGEVQPYTATATYTNNSGQTILPALRLKSQSGNLLALTFPVGSTIADGSASEVTFVPPFGSASASSTPSTTVTGAYALVTLTNLSVGAGNTLVGWDHFSTTDTTVFATSLDGTNPNNQPGDTIILLQAAGEYQVHCAVQWSGGTYERDSFLGNSTAGPLVTTQGVTVQSTAQAGQTPVDNDSLWTSDDISLWTDGSAGFGNAAMNVIVSAAGHSLLQAYMGVIYVPGASSKTDVY